jgi:pimeloyl-ACP methyl ester carboxylesterase
MKDVVVLLPGITGSVLQKDGKDVWAFTKGAAFRALVSLGESVQDLALDGDDPDLDDLGDGVTAARLMPDIHLIPGLWKIDGYGKIAETLLEYFDLVPEQNYFEFPYDWRRDCRPAARALARRSHDWLAAWRERSGNTDAKLILVAHSLGGLVARHFLELLDGWKETRALVTFGTPYRGALNAVDSLVHGVRKTLGPITLIDLSALIRSFTSVYQLLPIYPCFDPGDGRLARIAETTGIPNIDMERAAAALAFHRDIETAVDAHRRDDVYVEDGYAIHPIVGTFQRTLQSARRVGEEIEMLAAYEGRDEDGDGTVPRVSATPIELSDDPHEMYASERHGTLQNKDQVLVQLAGILSRGELDLEKYKAFPGMPVGLDIGDVFGTDHPVPFEVRCADEVAALSATVFNIETGAVEARTQPVVAPEWTRLELPPLPEGTHRIVVDGGGAVEPVSDVLETVAGIED